MRLPKRPIRSLFRFLFKAAWAAVVVGADLNPPQQREETKPRAARRINIENRER